MKLSKTSLTRLEGLNAEVKLLPQLAIDHSPHDFGIPQFGGYINTQTQKELYEVGRSVYGDIVTNCDGVYKKSYHQSGFAFDIFIYDEHGACWKCTEKYKEVAAHIFAVFDFIKDNGYFEDMKLEWGGNWKRKDLPHFQVVGIK